MMKRKNRNQSKPRRANPPRGALPLVALAVTLFLTSSILNAGALPDVPETPGLQAGTGGNEKYAVEYKDGNEVNTDCGFLAATCVGAGAVVIDIEETFLLFDFMGELQLEVTIGASIGVAASGGFAYALPTGSVWARGWGEVIGGDYSEYHRNGYLEGGSVDDDDCFKTVPGQVAKCDDHASVTGDGGNCVRALAQAKASNAADHAVSQRSTTEIYAAAHTESTCVAPDAVEDAIEIIENLMFSDNEGVEEDVDGNQSGGQQGTDCWKHHFTAFPKGAQTEISAFILESTNVTLDLDHVVHEAQQGGVEEEMRLLVVELLIEGVNSALREQMFTVCTESE